VTSTERLYDVGTRRADRWRRELGEEFRNARLRLDLSQQEVADAARTDRADYSRIERGKLDRLSLETACRIGAVLGLDVSVKAFPGGRSIRDAGQAPRLQKLLECVGKPLRWRLEVPLPAHGDRPDQRAWDVMIFGHGERTGIEIEARLYDLQAQLRRLTLKQRDDPVDHLLFVVADTQANRRVLAEFSDLLGDLRRLQTDNVLRMLRGGEHPPTGLILLDAPRRRAAPGAS
jgi:transcriptional regulator with XRE-family HTH domain